MKAFFKPGPPNSFPKRYKSNMACLFANIPSLHIPLMTLLDFKGFRILAVADIPLTNQLVYGWDNEKKKFVSDKESTKAITELSSVLNLSTHFVALKGGKYGFGQAIAKFDYKADQKGDLSFNMGDTFEIMDRSDPDGWWTGELNGNLGTFPSNYVDVGLQICGPLGIVIMSGSDKRNYLLDAHR